MQHVHDFLVPRHSSPNLNRDLKLERFEYCECTVVTLQTRVRIDVLLNAYNELFHTHSIVDVEAQGCRVPLQETKQRIESAVDIFTIPSVCQF